VSGQKSKLLYNCRLFSDESDVSRVSYHGTDLKLDIAKDGVQSPPEKREAGMKHGHFPRNSVINGKQCKSKRRPTETNEEEG
jgi:hypothetical protein